MQNGNPQSVDTVDLTNCDHEPIHIPGRIQSFGCLISVTSDWIVNHASVNASEMLGLQQSELPGMHMTDLIPGTIIHDLRSRLQMLSYAGTVERLFGQPVGENGRLFDIAIHKSGQSIIIEFEPQVGDERQDYTGYVRPMIERIGRAGTIAALSDNAARHIKAITGMDRVMVYRFASDQSGEVIAEARNDGMEPFLDLRYPASDIPKQARALYERNLLRIIADASDDGVVIEPTLSPEGNPLDLSMSTTRAVSPIHLEYLKNMGVSASMSISILRRGKLWGLFACHHAEPLVLPFQMRTALELFAQMFGYILDQKEIDAEQEQSARSQSLHDRVMSQLAEGSTIAENFDVIVEAVNSVISFDGVCGWLKGEFRSNGETPTEEEFMALVPFLNTTAQGKVYATSQLLKFFPKAEEFADRTAGLLALPVSRTPRDYIVFFRREMAKSVKWAGNPDKPVESAANGARLTPRKSFETWRQIVRNQSAEWTKSEIGTAEALRITLLEVVLRMTDASMKERSRAQEQQELLIAELNHRVRNILNLIKGLVNQSGEGATDIASFTELIGGRIHSLARAHDQVTKKSWEPASLYELILNEAEAYLSQNSNRARITGTDALIEPNAFITVSLVIHELLTNSMKYGALSNTNGSVSVDIRKEADGALSLNWSESGGPPVVAPKRRGFGTTIIERSIPYELNGTADIRFEVSGLRAEFMIPETYIANYQERAGPEETVDTQEEPSPVQIDRVLVVEDNIIIALDARSILESLGVRKIDVASNVSKALSMLSENSYEFSLLDVNLGDETSDKIADALQETGIPFVFATGYGEMAPINDRYPNVPIIQKPYDANGLAKAISKVL